MGSNTFRILLIDNNEHGHIARRTALEEAGYEVETAIGGGEGLRRFDAAHFDLVVTDFRMPEVDGADVIRGIRGKGRFVPVVILSGCAERLGLTAETTGADAVLLKGPAEEKDLIRAVRRLMKRPPASQKPKRASPRRSGKIA